MCAFACVYDSILVCLCLLDMCVCVYTWMNARDVYVRGVYACGVYACGKRALYVRKRALDI